MDLKIRVMINNDKKIVLLPLRKKKLGLIITFLKNFYLNELEYSNDKFKSLLQDCNGIMFVENGNDGKKW